MPLEKRLPPAAAAEDVIGGPYPAAQNDRIVQLPASELYIVINGLTAVQNVLESVHDAMQS